MNQVEKAKKSCSPKNDAAKVNVGPCQFNYDLKEPK